MNKTTTIERLTRSATLAGAGDGERGFFATIASRSPVHRRDARGPFLEVLDPAGLEPVADVPLLADHRAEVRSIVGRVTDIAADGGAVTGTLRLSEAADVEPIVSRIRDGSVTSVSAGYSVSEWRESRDGDRRVKTAVRWQLLEVSLVAVPADQNAKIELRSQKMFDIEQRQALIESLRGALALPDGWGADLTADAVTDAEVRESAREAWLLQNPAPRVRATPGLADEAAVRTRAADAISYRMGSCDLPDGARDLAAMSLLDHARESLARAGVSARGMSPDEVFSRSLSNSDFPLVVSNAAGKTVAQGYQAARSALTPLFRQRSLSDFKVSTSIRLGGLGMLEELSETGEIVASSRDEEGETIQLRTFARRLDLSRRLLVNDDLGLFGDAARALGEAAAATEAQLMVDQLTGTATLSDGQPLFHASRGNIVAPSADLIDTLADARLALRQQRTIDGTSPIQATPKFVVCGPEMETALERALAAITPATVENVNPFAGRLQLLVEPRLTGTDFYVAAEPAQAAAFVIAHLGAAPGPQVQRQDAWNTLGVSFRCWLDVGTGFAGWRGIVKVAA